MCAYGIEWYDKNVPTVQNEMAEIQTDKRPKTKFRHGKCLECKISDARGI